MVSQDSRTHKAVGVVAHLGDSNCFVKDHAQLSPLLCSLFRCELTQRHASESPLKYPIYLPKSGTAYGRVGLFLLLLLRLGTSFLFLFWFLVFFSFFFFHVCSFLCQRQFENLAIFFYQSKLSLAFQHSSGMLLFPLRFRLVTFVVKSQRHSVLSVLYCSLLCECFVGTWAHLST